MLIIRALSSDTGSACVLSSTLNIVEDIEERENERITDRLAIIANCCDYPIRLDVSRLETSGHGLSSCILALCFANGLSRPDWARATQT